MELVIVRDGSRELLVEQSCIREILIHPQIHEVPGAPPDIRGILLYGDEPAVIYRMGDGEAICGIIMNGNQDSLWGITGEPAGEEVRDADGLVSIMPGIWENYSDTTE